MRATLISICSLLIVIALYSCGGNSGKSSAAGGQDTGREAYLNTIHAIENKMKASSMPEPVDANLAITAYGRYAYSYPQDTLSPLFLFKSGNLAMATGQYKRALGIFDNISAKYPSFSKLPDCIFIEGFIYDENLKDTANAHAKYKEVLQRFPNSYFAKEAEASIGMLGKSNEEIIKEAQEKNKN
jgi:outer membrane protein assembly factor BamD (BamD/ComL family)